MPASASNSWRLSVKEIDRSSTVIGEAGSIGAMVIRAPKGPKVPIKINKGEEKRITDIFGKPSSTYPDIWEAIEYCKQDALWIAAPYDENSGSELGGVLVTDAGTEALADGVDPDLVSSYSFNSDNEYFALLAKSPYTDDLAVKVTYNTDTTFFTIALYKTEDSGVTYSLVDSYTVSLVENQKDGFGKNIYIEEIFEDNDYLQVVRNSTYDIGNGFVDDSTYVAFAGGAREEPESSDLVASWDYFKQIRKYAADIFMDPTADPSVVTAFDSLRSSYQKYSFYIMAMPSGENSTTAIATKEGYGVNNAGLAFYWNQGKVRDTYNNSSFWTSLIGRVGVKLAQMSDIYNGGAPAWQDENNHGGQLGSGIIEMEYDPTETELEALDTAGINPIVQYPSYGTMIVSQRTAQSPNNLSDSSWIAHRRLFDYIISNVMNQVLVYQIVKLNDELHRRLAVSKTSIIMDPILAENLLAEYIAQCDTNNNDANTLAQRKFILTLGVKVTPFSETVQLEFVNVGQTVSVSEVIG